jgi:hypothetical protein
MSETKKLAENEWELSRETRDIMAKFEEAGRIARKRGQHVMWKGKLIQYERWRETCPYLFY